MVEIPEEKIWSEHEEEGERSDRSDAGSTGFARDEP
jgi:hypothetical protein